MENKMNHIIKTAWGFAEAQILNSSLELELFDKIDSGFDTIEKMVAEYNYDREILNDIFIVLNNLDFLTVNNEGYQTVNNEYKKYLLTKSEYYIGNVWEVHNNLNKKIWKNLTASILNKNEKDILFSSNDNDHWSTIIPYLNGIAKNTSKEIVKQLDQQDKNLRVLDLGCGSGAFITELLKSNKTWTGIGLDTQLVTKIAKQQHSTLIETGRIDFMPADIFTHIETLGKFDIVFLSNILHGFSYKQNRELIETVKKYLTSEGRIIVNEFMISDKKEVLPIIFDLQFLQVGTGKSFTEENLDKLFLESNLIKRAEYKIDGPYNCYLYS